MAANESSFGRRLKDRRGLVTGANSGIGRAIAIRLAEEGAAVGINYVSDPDAAEEVVTHIKASGGKAIAIKADVSSETEVDVMFNRVLTEFGGLDILVNNAGMETHHPFLEMPVEAWRKVIEIDLTGAFLCAQRAARTMVTSGGGCIVNITSVHQTIPWAGYSHYCAAKAALDMLTKTAAQELAEKNVRINSVAPGAIATPINQNVWGDPEGLRDLLTKIPAKRLGKPEEIASAVVFLCSDEANYINGTTLFVDGGMTLYASFSEGG